MNFEVLQQVSNLIQVLIGLTNYPQTSCLSQACRSWFYFANWISTGSVRRRGATASPPEGRESSSERGPGRSRSRSRSAPSLWRRRGRARAMPAEHARGGRGAGWWRRPRPQGTGRWRGRALRAPPAARRRAAQPGVGPAGLAAAASPWAPRCLPAAPRGLCGPGPAAAPAGREEKEEKKVVVAVAVSLMPCALCFPIRCCPSWFPCPITRRISSGNTSRWWRIWSSWTCSFVFRWRSGSCRWLQVRTTVSPKAGGGWHGTATGELSPPAPLGRRQKREEGCAHPLPSSVELRTHLTVGDSALEDADSRLLAALPRDHVQFKMLVSFVMSFSKRKQMKIKKWKEKLSWQRSFRTRGNTWQRGKSVTAFRTVLGIGNICYLQNRSCRKTSLVEEQRNGKCYKKIGMYGWSGWLRCVLSAQRSAQAGCDLVVCSCGGTSPLCSLSFRL